MMDREFDFSKIERKWQKAWESKKAFVSSEKGKGKKFYCLEMYPYPSSSGLHMGHAFNYTIGDILARFKRMNGFNVLYPMGFDSFGLPAENAAIKAKSHPKKFTDSAIANFIKQQKSLGLSYDWTRVLKSHDPNYYKWDQWFFLKLLEKGLAYRKKASVNWCSLCKTVLANEQVHNGKCWRHGDNEVEIKELEQWFFKTTEYVEELLSGIDKLDWPERIKTMQRNWMGKSEGSEVDFVIQRPEGSLSHQKSTSNKISEVDSKKWPVFTTRADTLFGVTFMVISARHPRLMEIVTDEQKKDVGAFVERSRGVKQEDLDLMEKEGVFTGAYAEHPLTGEKIPVWAGNFVLAEYGSGMVMAVPAHDQRDLEFAKKYKLPIKVVVVSETGKLVSKRLNEANVSYGTLVNSEGFNGLKSAEAKEHITSALAMKKLGRKTVQYKLRDWLISRQRYWGAPIPVVYCEKCGVVPVSEKDLPVVLPEKVKFGEGNPLESSKEFLDVKCPKCGSGARRETDTMDTFVDSSWYFLRYTDASNNKKAFDSNNVKYWMPVDFYVGGAEHAVMHLIYARFITKVLRDMGYLDKKINEPFLRLYNQGMVHAEDGRVMAKSLGNTVDPMETVIKYGADALRLFLVSNAGPDKDFSWNEKMIGGSQKFLKRVVEYFGNSKVGKSSRKLESAVNKTVKEFTGFVDSIEYNYAVIRLRKLFSLLESEDSVSKSDLESFVKMLSVICPHLGEELWGKIGGKGLVSLSEWPSYDEKKIDSKFEEIEEMLDKTVGDIGNIIKIVKEKGGKDVEKVYLYVIPNELDKYASGELGRRVGAEVNVFSVSDKGKYDPEGKASKAKPGKQGIFVE
jgi:leucyl-tRNA synthetase